MVNLTSISFKCYTLYLKHKAMYKELRVDFAVQSIKALLHKAVFFFN